MEMNYQNKLRAWLLCCFCLTLGFVVQTTTLAQNEDRRIWDVPYGEDRFILSFHLDQWLDAPSDVDQQLFSLGVDSYIMYDYKIGKSPISFAWGYGFSSFNVHHNGFFQRDSINGELFTNLHAYPEDYSFQKNKHSATFVEIPLELRLRTRGKNKFKFFVGGTAGYLVNYHYKHKADGKKVKVFDKDEMGVNQLRYGVTAKIGFNGWSLSGFYSLTPFFEEGEGVEMIPLSLGVTFFLL